MGSTEEIDNILSHPQSLSSFEMGRDDVNVLCTHGKITLWFGRQVPYVVIGQVLIGISSVDASSVHEYNIVCPFKEITDYESHGYVLVSYAKTDHMYKTTFNVPFSSKTALLHFAESISKKLKDKNINIDIYWTGDDADIVLLYEKLSNIDGWKLKQAKYKDDGKDK
ncbi:MAG TPA: hypothetical protein C5S50_11195 [Methanosarcinaceae archaeon]|nr:hypothetical protein [Methanosarcinaceae archaeon]